MENRRENVMPQCQMSIVMRQRKWMRLVYPHTHNHTCTHQWVDCYSYAVCDVTLVLPLILTLQLLLHLRTEEDPSTLCDLLTSIDTANSHGGVRAVYVYVT